MTETSGGSSGGWHELPPPIIDSFIGEYAFLSNFHPLGAGMLFKGIVYPTSEHAYQAEKSASLDVRRHIAKLHTPTLAKRYGKIVKRRPDFDRDQSMLEVVLCKFQIPDLKQELLHTNDSELIEGNAWGDIYWGVCEGKGQNKLGKTLMRVRALIQKPGLFDEKGKYRERSFSK